MSYEIWLGLKYLVYKVGFASGNTVRLAKILSEIFPAWTVTLPPPPPRTAMPTPSSVYLQILPG